jgi:GH24 family phage-related lysozyme (muramidase)
MGIDKRRLIISVITKQIQTYWPELKISQGTIYFYYLIEGWSDTLYTDTTGNQTIGLGHKLTAEDKLRLEKGLKLDREQLVCWAANDIVKSINLAESQPEYKSKVIRPVFGYLIFNLGAYGFSKFVNFRAAALKFQEMMTDVNALKMLNELADSKWATQVPRALRIISNYVLRGEVTANYLDEADYHFKGEKIHPNLREATFREPSYFNLPEHHS